MPLSVSASVPVSASVSVSLSVSASVPVFESVPVFVSVSVSLSVSASLFLPLYATAMAWLVESGVFSTHSTVECSVHSWSSTGTVAGTGS